MEISQGFQRRTVANNAAKSAGYVYKLWPGRSPLPVVHESRSPRGRAARVVSSPSPWSTSVLVVGGPALFMMNSRRQIVRTFWLWEVSRSLMIAKNKRRPIDGCRVVAARDLSHFVSFARHWPKECRPAWAAVVGRARRAMCGRSADWQVASFARRPLATGRQSEKRRRRADAKCVRRFLACDALRLRPSSSHSFMPIYVNGMQMGRPAGLVRPRARDNQREASLSACHLSCSNNKASDRSAACVPIGSRSRALVSQPSEREGGGRRWASARSGSQPGFVREPDLA
jgi:hypothetical protein